MVKTKNTMVINKNAAFEGWETWKTMNKNGMDCTIEFRREGNKITTVTENGGIAIKSVTTLKSDAPEIYVALTGDEVAITNIRIN